MVHRLSVSQLLHDVPQWFKNKRYVAFGNKRGGAALIVIIFGIYVFRQKSETFRIGLGKLHSSNVTRLIQFTLYSIRYHLPLILNDLLIFTNILLSKHEIHNEKPSKLLVKLILFSILNILICFVFHYSQKFFFPINGIFLFEKIVEKPKNNQLFQHLYDIDNLLDYHLNYIPYLKNEIWSFLNDPNEIEIDFNSPQKTKENVLSYNNNKKKNTDNNNNNDLTTIRGVNMKEFIVLQQYVSKLKYWIKKEEEKFNFFKEFFLSRYSKIVQSMFSLLRVMYDTTDDEQNTEAKLMVVAFWGIIQICKHLIGRIIIPMIWYFIILKRIKGHHKGNKVNIAKENVRNLNNGVNINLQYLFQRYKNYVIAREPIVLIWLIWFAIIKLYNKLMIFQVLKLTQLSNFVDNVMKFCFAT